MRCRYLFPQTLYFSLMDFVEIISAGNVKLAITVERQVVGYKRNPTTRFQWTNHISDLCEMNSKSNSLVY